LGVLATDSKVYVERQKNLRIVNSTFNKKNEARGLTSPGFKSYYMLVIPELGRLRQENHEF
jgi:hypothetical protein